MYFFRYFPPHMSWHGAFWEERLSNVLTCVIVVKLYLTQSSVCTMCEQSLNFNSPKWMAELHVSPSVCVSVCLSVCDVCWFLFNLSCNHDVHLHCFTWMKWNISRAVSCERTRNETEALFVWCWYGLNPRFGAKFGEFLTFGRYSNAECSSTFDIWGVNKMHWLKADEHIQLKMKVADSINLFFRVCFTPFCLTEVDYVLLLLLLLLLLSLLKMIIFRVWLSQRHCRVTQQTLNAMLSQLDWDGRVMLSEWVTCVDLVSSWKLSTRCRHTHASP